MKLVSVKWRTFIPTVVLILILTALLCASGCQSGDFNNHDFSWLENTIDQAADQRQEILLREEQLRSDPTFRQGITICGMPVGGMAMDEAETFITNSLSSAFADISINLTHGTYFGAVSAEDLGLTYTNEAIKATLNEAFNVARTGSLDEMTAEIEALAENGQDFLIEPTFDTIKYNAFVKELSEKVEVEATNASFTIDKKNMEQPFVYESEVRGLTIDMDALDALLLEQFMQLGTNSNPTKTCNIPVEPLEPDITVDDLKSIHVLRTTFYTSYSNGNGYNRVFNIRKAAGFVHGTVLDPEEVFSTNNVLGDRTIERGWLMAPGYTMGGAGTEDSPGGGVCQVSTTLYNAVIKSNLEIVYRQNHSRMVNYIAGGLDATIDTGRIDFLFKNNTQNPIYIFCWLEESRERVHCAIYGEAFPEAYDRIEFVSEKISETPPSETEYVEVGWLVEPYWMLRNPARTGYVYKAFQQFYLRDTLVNTLEINTSVYRMHPKRYYVWPGYVTGTALQSQYELTASPSAPLPTPTPDPTPTIMPTPVEPTEAPTESPVPDPTSNPGPTMIP